MAEGQRFLQVCRKLRGGGAVMKINERLFPVDEPVLTDAALARDALGLPQTSCSPASIPQYNQDGKTVSLKFGGSWKGLGGGQKSRG